MGRPPGQEHGGGVGDRHGGVHRAIVPARPPGARGTLRPGGRPVPPGAASTAPGRAPPAPTPRTGPHRPEREVRLPDAPARQQPQSGRQHGRREQHRRGAPADGRVGGRPQPPEEQGERPRATRASTTMAGCRPRSPVTLAPTCSGEKRPGPPRRNGTISAAHVAAATPPTRSARRRPVRSPTATATITTTSARCGRVQVAIPRAIAAAVTARGDRGVQDPGGGRDGRDDARHEVVADEVLPPGLETAEHDDQTTAASAPGAAATRRTARGAREGPATFWRRRPGSHQNGAARTSDPGSGVIGFCR